MTETIQPALSAEEWARCTVAQSDDPQANAALHSLIALDNAALPDDDPQKITRALVGLIRDAAGSHRVLASDTSSNTRDWKKADAEAERLWAFADALESYLPPEGP